jgi:hypothetical protein
MNYSYVFVGGINNSYVFETKNKIVYEIKFKPTDYLFDKDKNLTELTFEFIIELIINETGKKPPLDQLVSNTIFAILTEFFNSNEKHVCLYICDSSDGKQDIRRRKFDDWFYKHQDGEFIKIDEVLIDSRNEKYPISLIIKKENPYLQEIFMSFASIIENNGK